MAFRGFYTSTVNAVSCLGCGTKIRRENCEQVFENEKIRKVAYSCKQCHRKGKVSIFKEIEKGLSCWGRWPKPYKATYK